MKKNIFILSVLLSSITLWGQVKFGLKFSPNVSLTSVRSDSAWKANAAGMRFIGGIFTDISLTDNAAFHIGLEYTPKRVGLKYDNTTSSYSLQYLQLPFGFKFFTNEFADRFKVYFLIDPNLAFKISERSSTQNDKYVLKSGRYDIDIIKYADENDKKAFNFFDMGINIGAGTEIRIGESTYLFGGLSYNRGLINAINPFLKDPSGETISKKARVTSGLINLDLGIKF